MSQDGAPMLKSGPAPRTDLQLATADTDVRLRAAPSEWGIYLNNEKIIQPDSILALDYHREWTVADFPMEQGAFSSYDKVAKPFDIRLRMTKGGNDNDRRTFLATVENLGASLTLYDVVTPDRVYLSVTITSLGYNRTATNGVGLLTVDVGLREIRVTAESVMTAAKVKDPGSANAVHGGTVQPQQPSPAAKAAAQKALARQVDLPLLALRGQLR
jgi:hypothetical protein